MGLKVSFAGLSEERSRLARLTEGLAKVAGGAVLEEAAKDIAARVDRMAKPKIDRHKASGGAEARYRVYIDGGIVKIDVPEYVRLHSWWSFRRGMPGPVVKYAAQVMAAKYLAAIGDGEGAQRALAKEVDDEARAGKAKKEVQKNSARLRLKRRSVEKIIGGGG